MKRCGRSRLAEKQLIFIAIFLHVNSRAHTAEQTISTSIEAYFQSPHSAILVSSNYNFFPNLEKYLEGKQFSRIVQIFCGSPLPTIFNK